MTAKLRPPSPELIAELRAEAERALSAAEFEAYVRAPMSDDERREIEALISWFLRRYPTVEARLAWGRRAWARSRQLAPGE